MIEHRLTLDYRLAPGWMAPFVDGLREGTAMARRCTACGRASFPPLRVCACGSSNAVWQALTGRATIQHRTEGADGSFALVHFEGADTRAVVRLEGTPADATEGHLMASDSALPQMWLGPLGGAP